MTEHPWEAALDQVLELTVLLSQDMADALARLGLTPSRVHLIWELNRLGPATQRQLASALNVTPRAITALVDALAGTGFVTREPHPTDRRATLVTFTEHGRTTARELAGSHEELARQLFAGLPAETFDAFSAGLGTVLNRLRALIAAKTRDGQAAGPGSPLPGGRSR